MTCPDVLWSFSFIADTCTPNSQIEGTLAPRVTGVVYAHMAVDRNLEDDRFSDHVLHITTIAMSILDYCGLPAVYLILAGKKGEKYT